MRPADNIHRQIRDLRTQASAELDERVYEKFQQALGKPKKISAEYGPIHWRAIMQSRITKVATAAVIIVAAAVSIMVFNKSMPRAFGIEQVIAAYNNVHFLHVKQFRTNQEQPNEFWIKSDEQGRVVKARYYLPVTEDGVKLITWKPEGTEIWFKSKRWLALIQTKRIEGWMQSIMEQCQPKLVMQKLLEDQKAGKIDIDIQRPQKRQEPAVIVATHKTGPNKEIYYIDQPTDLITRIEFYRIEDNNQILKTTTEFSDYNVPIDEKMFSLRDEVPKDVRIADRLNQLCGVPQGNMTDAQAAAETVRQFFKALVDKDYKKAGLISGGELEEYAKEEYGQVNVAAIVSIGPAIPQPDWEKRGFKVPCELEIINSDGQKVTWKPGVYVRPGDDEMHPDRWNITGGVNVSDVQMKILPNNEKYEKMTPKEAAEAFFKACAGKNWDEFSKFWPGSANDERMERMEEQMKEYLGGVEIISIGEPFQQGLYPGWFVPYEIKLRSGSVKKHNLAVRNDNAAQRYIVDGGI